MFGDTGRFVRLYPIPLRYLNDEQYFKKYQWIEADVRKARLDARPESFNIRCDGIAVGETVSTDKGDWGRRAEWVFRPGHVFPTVTALQEARERDGTSIGLVPPAEVLRVYAEPYPADERRDFWAKYEAIRQVQELPFEEATPVQPISPPDFRFKVRFRSGDREHEFTVFDWEVDALYFRLKRQGDGPDEACRKVVAELRDDVCGPDEETYFFLGNISSHPQVFTTVGLWYPKKPRPAVPSLFDGV